MAKDAASLRRPKHFVNETPSCDDSRAWSGSRWWQEWFDDFGCLASALHLRYDHRIRCGITPRRLTTLAWREHLMKTTLLLAWLLVVSSALTAVGQTCTPGSASPTGNAPCTQCVAGTYSPNFGALVCLPCEFGTFSGVGSAVCEHCPAGTFSGVGSATCTPCPDGSIAPVNGSAACQPCPPGFTSNATHTACIPLAVAALTRSWGFIRVLYR